MASAAVLGAEGVASVAVSADHHVAVVLLGELEKVRVLDTSTSETEDQVESGLLLDIVVPECSSVLELLSSEDETLLIRGDSLLILDLSLDAVDCVTLVDVEGDGLSCEGLHEDLVGHLDTMKARERWGELNAGPLISGLHLFPRVSSDGRARPGAPSRDVARPREQPPRPRFAAEVESECLSPGPPGFRRTLAGLGPRRRSRSPLGPPAVKKQIPTELRSPGPTGSRGLSGSAPGVPSRPGPQGQRGSHRAT